MEQVMASRRVAAFDMGPESSRAPGSCWAVGSSSEGAQKLAASEIARAAAGGSGTAVARGTAVLGRKERKLGSKWEFPAVGFVADDGVVPWTSIGKPLRALRVSPVLLDGL
jgi:hypothetical protein